MNKRRIKELVRWMSAIICWVLYVPHIICYLCKDSRGKICMDLNRYKEHFAVNVPNWLYLLYLLHSDRYFRCLFYYRIGPIMSTIIGWYRPGDKYFMIPTELKMGGGCIFYHPYATVLNAESIGSGFSCIQCTTLGYGKNGRPIIGDNVSLGASVTIIGNVHIGNNVTIGAGSVVVKDIPDNCVAVGNPARVIRYGI